MSPTLHHECTRVPVTALASCGSLYIAAEGPFLRFYHAKDSRCIASQRVFKTQAVHGIRIYSEEPARVIKLIAWGGRLVRAFEIHSAADDHDCLTFFSSNVAKAPDWIFDLAPRPASLADESPYQKGMCVAVTAHNALLQVTVQKTTDTASADGAISVIISDLTSSSRSILYSAHLFWENPNRVLVAAGTAFGEIIYWSWSDDNVDVQASLIHRVFLGHEGSIFGVRISEELSTECCQKLRRVVASCSDDRTIRLWDVSDVNTNATTPKAGDNEAEVPRTRHTGFSNEAFDTHEFGSSDCLAIGWGHLSRVWTIRFLETSPCSGSLLLQSAGEDATARTWELSPNSADKSNLPYKLLELDCTAYHSGKNMWSSIIAHNLTGSQQMIAGGADSKITSTPLPRVLQAAKNISRSVAEYTVNDILSWTQSTVSGSADALSTDVQKSSKKAEFFRSYCFVDETNFLLTTNSGKVLVASLSSDSDRNDTNLLSNSTLLGQPEDLAGYSVCASSSQPGIAFIAGANGSIYVYRKNAGTLTKLYAMGSKVGEIFAADVLESSCRNATVLLVTLVGQGKAQLLYVDPTHDTEISKHVQIPISDHLTGSVVTSMAHLRISDREFIAVGFRRGSIALYSIDVDEGQAMLVKVIEKAHSGETVTCLQWVGYPAESSQAQLYSAGRDGRLTVHDMDLSTESSTLVHDLALPFGPNLEGLYLQEDRLLVYGFSSKKWYLYDVTNEEEVMSIDTGGAHRSWTYRPHLKLGGTLVWTRASSMHIYSQYGMNHTVIRSGGHGREIKALTVSSKDNSRSRNRLIATGAEDTDIKLFQYTDGNLVCRRTLRKHTTGIQHLQWSKSGDYLFSSGGCEEFYVWRVRDLPSSSLDIGVVCESVYTPESEYADLRIMSFDVTTCGTAHLITMVFSDSSIKAYCYDPGASTKWVPLAKGLYFTSCLTQCIHLSGTTILTAGTDGHAVTWPLPEKAYGLSTESQNVISKLMWNHPAKIHQNSSKVMVSQSLDNDTTLVVSGGDDGSLAFLLMRSSPSLTTSPTTSYASPPILINRTHASAVTACALYRHESHITLLTSGNDEWVRQWEITLQNPDTKGEDSSQPVTEDVMKVRRLGKVKTSVADVSSMSVLDTSDGTEGARILVCGVGMEVIRVE
ncbi:hypothetical protein COCSADRAFT_139881 [Bipolaris sorokiniana ND90Pr]|uniref:Uncharacterized protein n=1 Tax=Cochliobolus sativus (strain ND90Pr / ATCC 201652) TaxID=665912 RepID=M2T9S2_COCSN|nr:uncharacterized protein COCSADRAFT_139881 [Bipolaris sorokiniana ND90Pr]EMD65662.1 hypothetical protein COCSADRAFT_139881 [Bipolaris sorokiniana ND90Pr]